jgi:2-C-methyl-D-erythritol 4-phosphate cytidylyltransferase
MSAAVASVTAVIAAAGSGERLGAGGPKAFLPLGGRPMVEWSIDAFRAAGVESIVVACPPGFAHGLAEHSHGLAEHSHGEAEHSHGPAEHSQGEVEDLHGEAGGLVVVDGGETRAASVSNALGAVETELVAIHDAARPFVTPELIAGVLATLAGDPDADGAIAAAPVTDTIKRASPSGALVIEGTLDRGRLWAAQTPQAFRVDALRRALEAEPDAIAAATDEAMLLEAAGGRVLIHESGGENLKVTTPFDLERAERIASRRAG